MLSLGAGVQSSALLLMAEKGIVPRPDFAIFADTGAEPKAVYEWLEYLKSLVSIPVYVTQFRDLKHDTMTGEYGFRIPAFIKRPDGKQGIAMRTCTHKYKINPIYKEIRKQLGYAPRKHVKHHVYVQMGISRDEITRMKESHLKWVTNEFPLIDLKLDRKWCSAFVLKETGRKPPRSACTFCPYRSNREWSWLKENDPAGWEEAIAVDRRIKILSHKYDGELYLHRQMVPLENADLSEQSPQASLLDECDGMCGV